MQKCQDMCIEGLLETAARRRKRSLRLSSLVVWQIYTNTKARYLTIFVVLIDKIAVDHHLMGSQRQLPCLVVSATNSARVCVRAVAYFDGLAKLFELSLVCKKLLESLPRAAQAKLISAPPSSRTWCPTRDAFFLQRRSFPWHASG